MKLSRIYKFKKDWFLQNLFVEIQYAYMTEFRLIPKTVGTSSMYISKQIYDIKSFEYELRE